MSAEPNPFLVERVLREMTDALEKLQARIGKGSHVFVLVHVEGVVLNGGTITAWQANRLLADVLAEAMARAFATQEVRTLERPPGAPGP